MENKAEPPITVYIILSGRHVFYGGYLRVCSLLNVGASGLLEPSMKCNSSVSGSVTPIYATHVKQCIYKA